MGGGQRRKKKNRIIMKEKTKGTEHGSEGIKIGTYQK